jgi:hypothetical protein
MAETGLLVLKAMLQTHRIRVPVLATLHGILASVEHPQPRRPWNWAIHLRQALRLPHPRQLTYLALSDSILAAMTEAMPGAASHFKAFDLPYFMGAAADVATTDAVIRFGHFGVARNYEKNFGLFIQLAEEVGQYSDRPFGEFLLVGFVEASATDVAARAAVKGLSRSPLSSEEYARRARSVTYAVGLADPMHYRLVASASFLDALRYLKPGIYLRNPYVEHYFNRLGDIGYLCRSYSEVRDVVRSVVHDFPQAQYRQQCENIRHGRRIFEPQAVAPRFRDIIEETQKALVR